MILYLYATYLTSHVKLMQIFKVQQLQDSTWSLRYTFLLKSLSEKEPLQIFNHPSSVRASQAKPLPNRDFSLLLLHLKEEGRHFCCCFNHQQHQEISTQFWLCQKKAGAQLSSQHKNSRIWGPREKEPCHISGFDRILNY